MENVELRINDIDLINLMKLRLENIGFDMNELCGIRPIRKTIGTSGCEIFEFIIESMSFEDEVRFLNTKYFYRNEIKFLNGIENWLFNDNTKP